MEGRYLIILNIGIEDFEFEIELCATDDLTKALMIVNALKKVNENKNKNYKSFDFYKIVNDFDKMLDSCNGASDCKSMRDYLKQTRGKHEQRTNYRQNY